MMSPISCDVMKDRGYLNLSWGYLKRNRWEQISNLRFQPIFITLSNGGVKTLSGSSQGYQKF